MDTQTAPVNGAPAVTGLPPVTVGKFEDIGGLLEQLVEEKTSVFVESLHRYRTAHRDGTARPLTATETAVVAGAAAAALTEEQRENPGATLAGIQQSDLRAYDEPGEQEVLLAAGLSTAPAFVDAARRVVALIEMPRREYEEACESDSLAEAIDAASNGLRDLRLVDGRARAVAALKHLAAEVGEPGEGKGWGLIAQMVVQALRQAVTDSFPGSSTALRGPTGGDEPTSFIGSDTGTRSST